MKKVSELMESLNADVFKKVPGFAYSFLTRKELDSELRKLGSRGSADLIRRAVVDDKLLLGLKGASSVLNSLRRKAKSAGGFYRDRYKLANILVSSREGVHFSSLVRKLKTQGVNDPKGLILELLDWELMTFSYGLDSVLSPLKVRKIVASELNRHSDVVGFEVEAEDENEYLIVTVGFNGVRASGKALLSLHGMGALKASISRALERGRVEAELQSLSNSTRSYSRKKKKRV